MRNMFMEGTYKAGVGVAVPQANGFRPLRMGQVGVQPASGMIPNGSMTTTVTGSALEDKMESLRVKKPSADVAAEGIRPTKLSPRKDRFQWAVTRMCSIMRKLSKSKANPNAVGRVFWAYVKHSRASEESVITAYKTMCPDLPVPEKPVKRVPEKPSVKVPITYQEAVQVSAELDKAMETVTEEAVVERADAETSGALAPEDLPQAEIAQEELASFVAAGDTGATLSVDQEIVSVADKAIEQASEIKTEKTTKGLLTAAGVVGAGALLYYLI